MKLRVAIIQRIFSSYRKPVYDLLMQEYNLLVLHSENNSGIYTTSTNYSKKVRSIKYSSKETNVFLRCFRSVFKFRPSVIIHEFATGILSMPLVYIGCRLLNIKFILWSHGYNRKKGFDPNKSILDKYRLWMLKNSDAIILYGAADKELLSKFINPSKIFIARNTLDTNELLVLRNNLEKTGRVNVKKRLGFNTKYNIIYIGRLLTDKLPHLLINLIDHLSTDITQNLTIHFVGDGPIKTSLINLSIKSGNPDIFRFYGNIYERELSGAMLYASDLMILPGEIGLSVNHSLCFQCPVMTFERGINGPFHGPEEEYVIDSITGFKIPSYNIKGMAESVTLYLSNPVLQNSMRSRIKKFVVDNLNINFMLKGIIDGVEYAKAH